MKGDRSITHLDGLLGNTPKRRGQAFDANRCTIECPVMHIAETTGSEWEGIND